MSAEASAGPAGAGRRSRARGWLALAALAGMWLVLTAGVVVIGTLAYRQHSPVIALAGLIGVNVLGQALRPSMSRLSAWSAAPR